MFAGLTFKCLVFNKLKMKILLVDDDEAITTVFSTALSKEGFETAHASTGKEGLDKVRSEMPDLVLLDQVLPDMQGNEVLAEIKKDEKTKGIPVVILSNFSQEELVKQAINEGAADYIFKYQAATSDVVGKVKQILAK